MAFRPVFLVTKIHETKRRAPAAFLTGSKEKETAWVVKFIHGYFPGVGMKFFFPERDVATAHFAPWELVGPKEALEGLPDTPYEVVAITKTKYPAPDNSYTGEKVMLPSWEVDMVDHQWGSQIALRFPDERSARRYSKGKAYRPQDMLGTLPASPADIEEQLQAKADQAKKAEDKARIARDEAEAAQYQHAQLLALQIQYAQGPGPQQPGPLPVTSPLTAQLPSPVFDNSLIVAFTQANQAGQQAIFAQAQQQLLEAEVAASAAEQVAEAAVADAILTPTLPSSPPGTVLVSNHAIVTNQAQQTFVTSHWWITNGGAAGVYDPIFVLAPNGTSLLNTSPGVHHAAGTFTPNGDFYGSFIPD